MNIIVFISLKHLILC